jgi:hypothetical protein
MTPQLNQYLVATGTLRIARRRKGVEAAESVAWERSARKHGVPRRRPRR